MDQQDRKRIVVTAVLGILLFGIVTGFDHDDRESIAPIQILEEDGMVVVTSTATDGSVAYGGEQGKIYLQNVEKGSKEPINWTVSEDRITALEWIPGTEWLLWGDASGTVGILDSGSAGIWTEKFHHGAVNALAYLGSVSMIEDPDRAELPTSPPNSTPPDSTSSDSTSPTSSSTSTSPDSMSSDSTPFDPTGSLNDRAYVMFAMGSDDASVSIVTIGEEMGIDLIRTLTDAGSPVRDLALSPDARMLAVGGLGQEVIVYETTNWTVVHRIPVQMGNWVTTLSWFSVSDEMEGYDASIDLLGIALSSRKIEWYNATDWEPNTTTNLTAWATDSLNIPDKGVLVLGGMDGNLTILGMDRLNETRTIAGEEPIVSLGEGSGTYDIAAVDSNGTLRFRFLNEAVRTDPVIVEPEGAGEEEPVDDPVRVKDGSDVPITEILFGFVLFLPIVLSLGIVGYLASRHENSASRIPVAGAVHSRSGLENGKNGIQQNKNKPTGRSADTMSGSEEGGNGGSKVVNIYIRDSVINRSNLLMEEDRVNEGEGGAHV